LFSSRIFLFGSFEDSCIVLMAFQIRMTSILGNYERLMAAKVEHLGLNYDMCAMLPIRIVPPPNRKIGKLIESAIG